MGMIEFGLVFNAILSINFASRDGSLIAAEAGNAVGRRLRDPQQGRAGRSAPRRRRPGHEGRDLQGRQERQRQIGSSVNIYNRTGSTTCTLPDGTTLTVPYTLSGSAGYVDTTRCNVQGGCGGSGGVDTIGVKITYLYNWFTPMGSFIGLGISNFTLVESNAMRMEPVL